MEKYIITNYYSDKNQERREELLFCVQKNLNLPFITGVIVFLDNLKDLEDLKKLKNFNKLVFVDLKGKYLLLKAIVDYCDQILPKNSVVILINLDIFLEDSESWKSIDKNFFQIGHIKKSLVCCRINLYEERYSPLLIENENLSKKRGDFSDAWVLTTPIDKDFVNQNLNFTMLGSPGADVLLMGLLTRHFHVFHWGDKYKIYHYDICRKSDQKKEIKTENLFLMQLNNRTDPRAMIRISESVKIPINQNWSELLLSKTKPNFTFIINQNEFFFYSLLRKLFLYIKIKYLLFKKKK